MRREIAAGHVYFGKDHTTQPAGISDLAELDAQVPGSVFERDRNPAGIALVDMLGTNASHIRRTSKLLPS